MSDTPSKMLYDDSDDIEDATPELDEEDFDFGALVEGILPTRKRVRIYPNGHLLAQAEELAERITRDGDDDSSPRVKQLEDLNAQLRQSYVVIVEARSEERRKAIEKEAYRNGVPNPAEIVQRLVKSKLPDGHPKREKLLTEADRGTNEVMLWQIADAIVYPTQGVTVESLQALRERAEPELDKIFRAWQQTNTTSVSVTPDLLQGRTGTPLAG